MNVDGVFARRKVLDIEVDFDALGGGRKSSGTNALALYILDIHGDWLGGLCANLLHKNQTGRRQKQRGTNGSSHNGSPPSGL
jgi:hypothetical protein